ncbi:MAG: hypothetical protein UH211_06745 [Agathobacter sp.]|nr:hypothetical protein [Agathobacter sp.]
MIYAAVLSGVYFLHLILKMSWWATAIVGVYALLMINVHKKSYMKQLYQTERFESTSLYIDTLLYAFVKEGKILMAFEDVYNTLEDGILKNTVNKAISHMRMTFDETEILGDSLKYIEEEFDCRRIKNVHEFMLHVEYYGGDIEGPVGLLLEDKSRWEQRIKIAIAERKKMFTDVIMSVIASVLICGIILYLPIMNVDISTNIVSQILSIVVIVLDDLIILAAQKYLAPDWLVIDSLEDEEIMTKKMLNHINYDEKKEKKLSFILAVIPTLLTVFCIYKQNKWGIAFSVLGILFMLNQHRIGHSLATKNLIKSVKSDFPRWLMDLALLLQSENVQVAIMKSRNHVPGILKMDVEKLVSQLEMDPESADPFHRFLKHLHLPEIHAAMGMLFAISIGNNARADKQINELISRNLEMMDVVDTQRLHDMNSGLYLLFLAPVLTASIKLLTDMAVFLLTFMQMPVI